MLMMWLQFVACAIIIGVAGVRLSRYGDIIAERTGLSGGWIGLVLLATVTSLPELVTGASSIIAAGVPNIAVGDALGSCVFNLLILVVLDFLQRGESVYQRAHQGHILSAGFGVVLIGFAGLNILLGDVAPVPPLGFVGMYTPVMLVMYMVAMRTLFVFERKNRKDYSEEIAVRHPEVTLRKAVRGYCFAALAVVAGGIWLPFIGVNMSKIMGWDRTFVGTMFVAAATSLPELAVTISALRIGALDMAIANLLGSNLFDMLILAIDDILYTKGPLLADVSPVQAITAMSAVMMTGIALIGLLYRPAARLFRAVGWVSLGLFTLYLLNTYVVFLHGE